MTAKVNAGNRRPKPDWEAAEEVVPQDSPPAADPPYWVYVLSCSDGSLYTGVARDVARRLAEHNGERAKGARYTAARRPVALAWSRKFASRSLAQREEARIKALTRLEKERLIGTAAAAPPTG